QPPLSTGEWGGGTFPILGENLSVNLRLRAVASDLTTSDILAFLKTHTQPSTRELPYQALAGFLEQPSVRTVNPQSVQDREALAIACTRPDVSLDDEEARLWSIRHPSVWRPSPETMAWRQHYNLDPLGCAQRARGTAILPNLNSPEMFRVTAENPETRQSTHQIDAAVSGDQNAYLDDKLATYLGLLVTTRPTPLMLLTEALVNGQPETVWTINGTAKITISRPHVRTTTYTCLVFEKGRPRGHGPPPFLPEPPIEDIRRREPPQDRRPRQPVNARLGERTPAEGRVDRRVDRRAGPAQPRDPLPDVDPPRGRRDAALAPAVDSTDTETFEHLPSSVRTATVSSTPLPPVWTTLSGPVEFAKAFTCTPCGKRVQVFHESPSVAEPLHTPVHSPRVPEVAATPECIPVAHPVPYTRRRPHGRRASRGVRQPESWTTSALHSLGALLGSAFRRPSAYLWWGLRSTFARSWTTIFGTTNSRWSQPRSSISNRSPFASHRHRTGTMFPPSQAYAEARDTRSDHTGGP
ncbi:hypothetical protein T484DRAFT_1758342, partial [Baffinella frigidus]